MLLCLTFLLMRWIQRSTNQKNMRNFIFRYLQRILTTLILLFFATALFCQTPDNPFEPGTTVEQVFTWWTGVYMGALMLLTRLQAAFFPKAGALPKTALRYVLIAAVVGILFVTLGFTNAWGIIIGFVGAALSYDKVIDPLSNIPGFQWLKTPKPVE